MFAVYATHAAPDDPLSALRIGELPEPEVPSGWVRVRISHASLNRHDLFMLRGITAHPEGITYPIILGNDATGTLDDGTPVVIYPMMGSDDWRGDETLDPAWHIPSEFVHGTFADYVVVPRRNAIPLPSTLSPLNASVLGTAWLTAYRALFTKSGLQPGETVLIQGATGGMATALIQLGCAAGFEVWATSRTEVGQAHASSLGAHQTFPSNVSLPRKVTAVIDNIGSDTWAHSMSSLERGDTLVITGGTTGFEVSLNILAMIANQLTITGSIMGTLEDMRNMINLIARTGIEPEIGTVLPMERTDEAFRAMWEGRNSRKSSLHALGRIETAKSQSERLVPLRRIKPRC
jgi:NADPH:quinone reductase-like Zn-dependent oxidoreductase